jgi:hypothetical protein
MVGINVFQHWFKVLYIPHRKKIGRDQLMLKEDRIRVVTWCKTLTNFLRSRYRAGTGTDRFAK